MDNRCLKGNLAHKTVQYMLNSDAGRGNYKETVKKKRFYVHLGMKLLLLRQENCLEKLQAIFSSEVHVYM